MHPPLSVKITNPSMTLPTSNICIKVPSHRILMIYHKAYLTSLLPVGAIILHHHKDEYNAKYLRDHTHITHHTLLQPLLLLLILLYTAWWYTPLIPLGRKEAGRSEL